MGGSVTFRESLRMRLNMIKPSRQQLQDFIESQTIEDVLTPGVTYVITRHCAWLIVVIISILYYSELISMLQDQGTTVYLVSGGFRCIIEYFADYLAIPRTNIYANRILFSEEGST